MLKVTCRPEEDSELCIYIVSVRNIEGHIYIFWQCSTFPQGIESYGVSALRWMSSSLPKNMSVRKSLLIAKLAAFITETIGGCLLPIDLCH